MKTIASLLLLIFINQVERKIHTDIISSYRVLLSRKNLFQLKEYDAIVARNNKTVLAKEKKL